GWLGGRGAFRFGNRSRHPGLSGAPGWNNALIFQAVPQGSDGLAYFGPAGMRLRQGQPGVCLVNLDLVTDKDQPAQRAYRGGLNRDAARRAIRCPGVEPTRAAPAFISREQVRLGGEGFALLEGVNQ